MIPAPASMMMSIVMSWAKMRKEGELSDVAASMIPKYKGRSGGQEPVERASLD